MFKSLRRWLTGAATMEEYVDRFLKPVYMDMIAAGATEDEAHQLIAKAIKESNPEYGKFPRAVAFVYLDCLRAGLSASEILAGRPLLKVGE